MKTCRSKIYLCLVSQGKEIKLLGSPLYDLLFQVEAPPFGDQSFFCLFTC